jgi:hypothetical protein
MRGCWRMRIEEISEITGKTRREIENMLNNSEFIELKLTE